MIYFDHAAAAPILPEVQKAYPAFLQELSGNEEAGHAQGYRLRQKRELFASELVSTLLPGVGKYDPQAVFFASDATTLLESVGRIMQKKAVSAWHSPLDHIANSKMLERYFSELKPFKLDSCGVITDLPTAANAPQLIMLTAVQSEIGVFQDLGKLITTLRQTAPEAIILLDAVQMARFYPYPANLPKPDLMLVSGAKLGAGSGAALLANGKHSAFFKKSFDALRSGEHIIGKGDLLQIAALTLAAKCCKAKSLEAQEKLHELNSFLRKNLSDMILPNGKKLILTVNQAHGADHILHMILPGYQSGVLVRIFSDHDIMLSSGSACAAETPDPSAILQALNYSREDAYSGLRLSLSPENTLEEAEIFIKTLKAVLQNY